MNSDSDNDQFNAVYNSILDELRSRGLRVQRIDSEEQKTFITGIGKTLLTSQIVFDDTKIDMVLYGSICRDLNAALDDHESFGKTNVVDEIIKNSPNVFEEMNHIWIYKINVDINDPDSINRIIDGTIAFGNDLKVGKQSFGKEEEVEQTPTEA